MRGLRSLVAIAALASGMTGAACAPMGGLRGVEPAIPFGRGGRGKTKRYPADHYQRCDPFFGIASRGRTGAKRRARAMADAYAKTGRRDRDNPTAAGNPFAMGTQRGMLFDQALAAGCSRNDAMKIARRLETRISKKPIGVGRRVPVHASGPGA